MIVSFNGGLGAGKTHSALEYALELCEREHKVLVTNMQIDTRALHAWACARGFRWLARSVRLGHVFYSTDIVRILGYRGAVVLLDEAGVFLSSKVMMGRYREFQPLIADLMQQRKAGSHLVWIAQVAEHVAHEIRDVTNFYFHVVGISGKLKFVTQFDGWDYRQFLTTRTFQKWFKGMLAFRLVKYDQALFGVYQTLDRLDGVQVRDPRACVAAVVPDDSHVETDEWVVVGSGKDARAVRMVAPRPPASATLRLLDGVAIPEQVVIPEPELPVELAARRSRRVSRG